MPSACLPAAVAKCRLTFTLYSCDRIWIWWTFDGSSNRSTISCGNLENLQGQGDLSGLCVVSDRSTFQLHESMPGTLPSPCLRTVKE